MALLLLLLPFAVPFGSLYSLPIGGANLTIADVLVAALVALWFARGVAARRLVIPHVALAWPFALFFGGALLSVTGALSLQASVKELVKWLELYLVYVAAATQVRGRYLPLLLGAVLLAGTAEAAVGIYQYFYRIGPEGFLINGGQNLRAYGTFEQPNPFAGYLALIAPIAVGIGLGLLAGGMESSLHPRPPSPGSVEGRDRRFGFWFPFALAALAAAATLAGIGLSYSRGALIAAAAGLAVVLIVPSRRAAFWSLLVAGLVAGGLLLSETDLLPPVIAERLAAATQYFGVFDVRGARVDDSNFAIVERMAHWQAAWGMFEDHPWLGVGFGNYAVVYPLYALPRWDDPLGHAHNYILNVMAEGGAITAAGYLLFWAAAFLLAWRAIRRGRGLGRLVAAGLTGALVALTVHNLVDNLFVHSVALQVGLYLGILEQIARSGDALASL